METEQATPLECGRRGRRDERRAPGGHGDVAAAGNLAVEAAVSEPTGLDNRL